MRSQGEVVDGEAVVGAGRVEVVPANPERLARRDRESRDRRGNRAAVRGRVAVERARRREVRGREIEGVGIGPGACREVCRVEAVLEVEPVGAAGRAEAPFLTGVRDVEGCDRAARRVRELRADGRRERAAQQRAERALGGAGRAEAVRIARGAGPVPALYLPSFVALVPASLSIQPAGSALEEPLDASVSKFCVYAEARLTAVGAGDETAPPIAVTMSASRKTALQISARRRVDEVSPLLYGLTATPP